VRGRPHGSNRLKAETVCLKAEMVRLKADTTSATGEPLGLPPIATRRHRGDRASRRVHITAGANPQARSSGA
jgi:hypothetical protein